MVTRLVLATVAAAAVTVLPGPAAGGAFGRSAACPPPAGGIVIPHPPPPGIYGAIWAPRGPLLALTARRATDGWGITTIEVENSRTHRRIVLGTGSEPSWSRDARHLSVDRSVEVATGDPCAPFRTNSDIVVLRSDGTGAADLTNTPDANESGSAWAPDGTRIAYVVDSNAGNGIAVYSFQTHTSKLVTWNPMAPNTVVGGTTPTAVDGMIVWSPDSRRLYFERTRGWIAWSFGTWVVNADGSDGRQLTWHSYLAQGAVSPDGRRIAYAIPNKTGHSRIWLMRADGTYKQPLTSHDAFGLDSGPLWTRDGKTLVFNRSHGATSFVRTLDLVDGTRRLVGPGSATSLSPDGRWISVIRNDSRSPRLAIVPVQSGRLLSRP